MHHAICTICYGNKCAVFKGFVRYLVNFALPNGNALVCLQGLKNLLMKSFSN